MSVTCSVTAEQAGALRALVIGADCASRHYAEAGYRALTAEHSFLPAAITALLVIMVGVIGFRLMLGLGGIRLNELPVLAVKVGLVLALTMQWPLFQTLVFDLAYDAPLEVAAATLRGDDGPSRSDPLNDAQAVYDRLQQASTDLARSGGAQAGAAETLQAHAAEDLAHAARTLLMTSAGALAASFAAIGIFTALGPLFLATMLLSATADLFLGWLRAMLAAALAPMLIWANIALLIAMVSPHLATLQAQAQAGIVDLSTVDQVVTIVQLFALTQIALIALGMAAALGLGFRRRRSPADARATHSQRAQILSGVLPRTERLAEQLRSSSRLRSVEPDSGAARRPVFSVGSRTILSAPAANAGAAERADAVRRGRFRDRTPGGRARW